MYIFNVKTEKKLLFAFYTQFFHKISTYLNRLVNKI